MGSGLYSRVYTINTGDTLLAVHHNVEHQNHITNHVFQMLDDYSETVSQMQTQTDPYPSGTESQATSGAGEVERLRYMTAQITGKTYWYQDPDFSISSIASWLNYRRPVLVYSSTTGVSVENNTGASNETKIVFNDGSVRSVTEDIASADKYRLAKTTSTANFTSGTEDSGMRNGLSVTDNSSYAVYAVKSQIDTSKFVLVIDDTFPSQANYATLNSRYGTAGWLYLGTIFYGDNSGTANAIVSFVQTGSMTVFKNSLVTGTSRTSNGVRLSQANATSTTWTYASGNTTSSGQLPANITHIIGCASVESGTNTSYELEDSSAARVFICGYVESVRGVMASCVIDSSSGMRLLCSATKNLSLSFQGFFDKALDGSINPMF